MYLTKKFRSKRVGPLPPLSPFPLPTLSHSPHPLPQPPPLQKKTNNKQTPGKKHPPPPPKKGEKQRKRVNAHTKVYENATNAIVHLPVPKQRLKDLVHKRPSAGQHFMFSLLPPRNHRNEVPALTDRLTTLRKHEFQHNFCLKKTNKQKNNKRVIS